MKKSFIIIIIFFSVQNLFAQNIPHANFTAPWGVQVNTFNGNLYLQRTDLVIPNQGLSIDLSFAYNSFRDTIDMGFGKGWSSTYSLHYETIGTDTVMVEMADGRRDVFIKSGANYNAPEGIFDTWEEYESEKFRLTTKYGMVYFFDNSTHKSITKLEDTNENTVTLTYTGEELTTVTDNSNRSVNLTWNAGHLTTITDTNFPSSRTVQFTYNDGFLTKVTDPMMYDIVYGYNDINSLSSILNEKGDEMQIQYNELEKVSAITTCIARITFSYNPDQGRTFVTEKNDNGDRNTTYAYDEDGKLSQKTGNCCGYNTQYQYDEDNNINTLTDANGNDFTASHDTMGNVLLTSDAAGGNQSFSFESTFNHLQSLTDKKGNASTFEYDEDGNLEKITQPEGIEIGFTYDATGNITTLTDGNGEATAMSYNTNNDIAHIQYPIGNETFVYDGVGNLKNSTDGNNNGVDYEYDALNRLTSVADDLNNAVQYEYDPTSNLTKEIDPNGNEKNYTYDAHHRLESVTTPSGTTIYGYDESDNLSSITDANTHISTFEYDERDLLIAESDPLDNRTSYTYDGNGNMLNRTDANGMNSAYNYDKLNRLLSKSYAGNTDNFSYDANGNLIQCSNNNISMNFSYDALNRMTSKTINNWGLTLNYEYDHAGNRTKMTDPAGITFYEYDANNRLTKITNPSAEETSFMYDLGGRLTHQVNHNGTYTEYLYDVANRLLSLQNKASNNTILSSYVYTYDANGNRLTMTTQEGIATYTYDADNRLKTVNYTGISATNETYQMDATGNRTSLNGTNYTYDTADRLQTAGSATYDFDANGNLILKTENGEETHYHYDGDNRLIKVELPDGNQVQYQYDPFGNRISQTVENTTTRYLLDGGNVLMELDASGNTLARYTSGLALDSWISMERSDTSYVYHTDGLGSITALTDTSENISAEYQYDAYGNILAQSGNVQNPYTYTGREFDEATGLYYYRTRFYDAEVGRFLMKDGFTGFQFLPKSQNRYIYVGGNPMIYNDPNGLFWNIVIQGVIRVAPVLIRGAITVGKALSREAQALAIRAKYAFSEGKKVFQVVEKSYKNLSKTQKINIVKHLSKESGKFVGKGILTELGFAGIKIAFGKNDKQCLTTGDFLKGIFGPIKVDKFFLVRATSKYYGGPSSASKVGITKTIGRQFIDEFFNTEIHATCINAGSGSQVILYPKEDETPNPDNPPPGDGTICIPIVRSKDPNEIISPDGCDIQNWVAQSATLPYTILFENDPDFATAPAQKVIIEHTFDADINPFSFRLGNFGFGDYYFQVQEDVSYYNTQIDLSDSLGVLLDVSAGLDAANNRIFWVFESKDPVTGFASTLPADVGFLLVNDSLTHVGEGFVNFTAKAKNSSLTGDTIHAVADIIFDGNPAILTNLTFNLIDADYPVSQIQEIDTLNNNQFELTWEASDEGSGIVRYLLYVSTNEEAFLPIEDNLTETTYVFTGEADNTYKFFTIAIDCAGNIEPLKDVGENGCILALADTTLVNPTGMEANGSISVSVLGSVGNLTYDWSPNVSSEESIATNLSTGTYFVTVSDELGCSLSLEIFLDSLIVGVQEIEIQTAGLFIHRLYPVPAESQINIDFTSSSSVIWMEVFDTKGQKVLGKTVSAQIGVSNTTSLKVNAWSAGNYLIRLQTKTGSVSGMFTKQ